MNRQAKKELYANLDPTEIGNSRKFWTAFKPIFTKGNSYFVNITDTLDLPEETISVHEDVTLEDPVLQAINKYQHHPSIQMIKQNVGHLAEEDKFEFSHINPISV